MRLYELCRYKNQWAIYCKTSRVYYFGKKSNLLKRLEALNAK